MDLREFKGKEVVIKIDYAICGGAGECADVCPSDVFEIIEGKAAATNVDECIECCSCVEVCPVDAILHSSCD
ncbi:ferredoxin family protein [Candidatus Pacearchaeota archaeon]|nr:ferredoxin family protein [Candidatus Pacearchaeota archaeon]